MSFQQGLSGLNATSKNLDVIGNNIANANTYGAKSSRAEFADMYATAVNGSGANSVGIGVSVAAVSQQFSQGSITATSNPMDLAINGAGFFQVSDGNNPTQYTRNGQFKIDKDGFVVNNQSQKLLGYPATGTGRDPARAGTAAAAADRRHRAECHQQDHARAEPRLARRGHRAAEPAPPRSTSPIRPPTTTPPR